MKHYVVYIPGLGDGADAGREKALKFWRIFGLESELVHMNWSTERGYTPKYDRVVKAITTAVKKGYTVSLVADSAGASMALNVFADHPGIHRVVTLCGVNSPKLKPSSATKQKNPAFDDSLKHLIRSLPNVDTSRVVSFYSFYDPIVAKHYSILKGAKNRQMPTFGHTLAIILALTIGAGSIARVIKKK